MCAGQVEIFYDKDGNAWNGRLVCLGDCESGWECTSQTYDMLLNPFTPNEVKLKVQRCVCARRPDPNAPPEIRITEQCQAALAWEEDKQGMPVRYRVVCSKGGCERGTRCQKIELIERRTYFEEGEASSGREGEEVTVYTDLIRTRWFSCACRRQA